jgi:hypothetical protein
MAYIGNTVQTQGFTPAIDYFNGNGVTVTFTLSRPVASVAQMIVAIDNVIQNPSSSYTVSGNAITFSSAPLSGTNNIWVEYTSLITTYAAISQDPSVIGDITASGGYLAVGDFGNSYIDGTILDYVTGNGRITVGDLDGLTIYNGGTSGRTALASWDTSGNLTNTGGAVIQGLTVGKGGGAVSYNTAVGLNTLVANTTGGDVTAIGGQALRNNTTGNINSAFGVNSLYTNTTGGYNTALGHSALFSNTTASNNTAVGYQSLYNNTTGTPNTAVGSQALFANTTGTSNTAVGQNSLRTNTTGANNTAVGQAAGFSLTTGGFNVALGGSDGFYGSALQTASTGSYNIAIGNGALASATTPQGCVAMGFQAAPNLTTGHSGIYVGYGTRSSTAAAQWEVVVGGNIYSTVTGKGDSTGFIAPGGNGAVYQGNNSATWSITSDARLKKNIVDNKTGLDAITSIQVRNFEYRTKDEITDLPSQNAIEIQGIQLGAIAQELKEILPDCVKTESTGVMSVDTTNLTWYLINAVKELNAKVTALEAQLESK